MHTPGPWTCQGQNVLADRPYPHWKVLAEVRIGTPKNWCDPEGEANARLIAAAPDLLDTCLQLLAALKDKCNGWPDEELHADPSDVIRLAEAVISKAEGRMSNEHHTA